MKKLLYYLATLAFFTLIAIKLWGQSPPPFDDGDPPPKIPIDGGAVALLAAGAAYGAKKIYDARKHKSED